MPVRLGWRRRFIGRPRPNTGVAERADAPPITGVRKTVACAARAVLLRGSPRLGGDALAGCRHAGCSGRHCRAAGLGRWPTTDEATVKAIVQDTYGSVDVLKLRELERPDVADDEVLVRVVAAG